MNYPQVEFHAEVSTRISIWDIKIYIAPYDKINHGLVSLGCISDWLVDWFWFSGPLRQYFSLYRAVSQREGERGEKV